MESNGLLSGTDTLEKDQKRLRVINHELKAWCENQKTSLAACKDTLISDLLGDEGVKDQAQDLNIRVANLKRKLNSQT